VTAWCRSGMVRVRVVPWRTWAALVWHTMHAPAVVARNAFTIAHVSRPVEVSRPAGPSLAYILTARFRRGSD